MKRILLSFILLFRIAMCMAAEESWAVKRDSLYRLCDDTFGTDECLLHCEEGIKSARLAGDLYIETSLNMLKVATYFNMHLHDRVIEFCDSIEQIEAIEYRYPRGYYTILSYRAESYLNSGKYRLAMKYAKDVYDAGMALIAKGRSAGGSISEVINGKTIVVAAIETIGSAYVNIGRQDLAMEYFDNGIRMCEEDIDSLYLSFIELHHYKCNAFANNYVAGADKSFIDDYIQAIESYGEYMGNRATENDAMVFKAEVNWAKLKIAIIENDREETERLMAEMDRMYDVSDVLKYTKLDYYTTKVEYYMYMGDMVKAMAYCDSCLMDDLLKQDAGLGKLTLRQKLDANHRAGFYDRDYDIAKQILDISDSISNQRMSASIEEVGVLMGLDIAKMETQREEAEKRQWAMVAIIAVMSAILIIVVFITRQNKLQKKLLEQEVARQTKEINEKNRDITDSINYAQRIQSALLPDISDLKTNGIEGAYVFFKPRNIVSGDFYWSHNEGNRMLLACADCTGHGVPGAFMSMIGTTLLNDICASENGLNPGEILERLDTQLINILNKKGEAEVSDGMDVAIISYNPASRSLQIAGARRPVYLIKQGNVTEIKGTKRSIGEREEKSRQNRFETKEIVVGKGDTLYMCSDGIADQFGGQDNEYPNGKRLKSVGLKKMLVELNRLTIAEQQTAIEKMYEDWKGTCYQVDDVSIIGLRF